MSPLIIFGVLVALLFGGAYLTKRRMGVLGLALSGGVILADTWGLTAGQLFASEDIRLGRLAPETFAIVVVTLLPAVILLLRGPSYQHSTLPRIVPPLLFTLLALALLIHTLQPLLTGSGAGIAIYRNIAQFRELIITAGLAAALADIFFMKVPKHGKPGPKH